MSKKMSTVCYGMINLFRMAPRHFGQIRGATSKIFRMSLAHSDLPEDLFIPRGAKTQGGVSSLPATFLFPRKTLCSIRSNAPSARPCRGWADIWRPAVRGRGISSSFPPFGTASRSGGVICSAVIEVDVPSQRLFATCHFWIFLRPRAISD